jgi:hypothetical protein
MKRILVLMLIGSIAAASAQMLTPTGWWLNSSRGVAITTIALTLAAVAVGFWTRSHASRNPIATPAALWFGANIGSAIVLFRSGPGTLFPIVLAIGAGIAAIAVAAGSLIGAALASVLNRRPG